MLGEHTLAEVASVAVDDVAGVAFVGQRALAQVHDLWLLLQGGRFTKMEQGVALKGPLGAPM